MIYVSLKEAVVEHVVTTIINVVLGKQQIHEETPSKVSILVLLISNLFHSESKPAWLSLPSVAAPELNTPAIVKGFGRTPPEEQGLADDGSA